MIESEVTGLARAEVIVIEGGGMGEAAIELVPAEQELLFVINRRVEARFCCAPLRVRSLVVGWLVGEGVIERPDEFIAMEVDLNTNRVDVQVSDDCLDRLLQRLEEMPVPMLGETPFERRTDTDFELSPERVEQLAGNFRKLFLSMRCSERMCYLAATAGEHEILTYGEGFHRVNATYRAIGELVLNGRSPEGRIVLLNFGLSRLLASRLARAGVAMAVCLAPPTSAAIEVANDYYLTIVSAGMGLGTKVYSAPWRVI